MKNLGVVITDGVGFRNFILSDFISEAKNNFDTVVLYSCIPANAFQKYHLNCKIVELDQINEKFITWFFRKAKEVAHLQLHKKNNFGIQDNFNTNKTRAKNPRGYATRFIYSLTTWLHSESWILRFNKLQQLTFQNNPIGEIFSKQLKEDQIDILFFTHQRPPFIAPLIYQAEKLKIKTVSFIFSWDNLASKGRMAGNFDHYLVWSDLMQSDLLHFYQSVKPHQIDVVGTPQFEPYVLDRYKTNKDDFYKRYNLDAALPVILFTCNDSSSKNDPFYLELLADYIASNKIQANLIVRTSPADVPSRFLYLQEKYPFIKWNFPDWILTRENHAEPWTQRVPEFDDVVHLKSVLQFSDVIINVLSTIILDGFLFDKPSICPVFGNQQKGFDDALKFLDYAHLQQVEDSNAVTIVKKQADYLIAIEAVLKNPLAKINEQKKFVALEIGKPLQGTSKRIASILSQLND
ncbi:glycosyltransferase family protein [Flavobacterium nackdongense]|uniref:UDP-glycosyltransferase n=1 Tax=Flavobacterium nackdongense TaxID=2547394 RepID=A0A4P6YCA1_9FLAO|nr:hypothetical protein [Flavobacterium nackdongense]QBN19878.1 hypothetical protein E1750_14055 [Flavobacterium nackdongense]